MKVFLISNMFPSDEYPFYGIFVKNIKEALEREGIIIDTSVINGKQNNIIKKIISYILFYGKSILKGVTNDFDIIYSHNYTHTFIPAIIIKILKRNKLVVHLHGGDLLSNNLHTRVLRKIFSIYLNSVDLWIVPSNQFREILKKKLNIEDEKIYIYPSGGVDTKIFKKYKNKTFWKEKIGIGENIFTIGYVSRIDQGKGWDIFLDTLSCLKKQGLKYKAVIVGKGSEIEILKQYINKLNLTSDVIYLGELKQEDLVYVYNAFDVFVFPTQLEESLGLVGIEAMACGVPVIGSRIGGLLDYILDGENGFFFEKGNSKDLCNKLIMFYNVYTEKKESFSENAIKMSKKYDKSIITEKLISKLRGLVNENFRYS